MRFGVALEGSIVVTLDEGEEVDIDAYVEEHLDRVMEEMMELDADDASIELDATDGYHVVLSGSCDAQDPLEAVQKMGAIIRSAIHAAGGGTPGWPELDDAAWKVTLSGSRWTELIAA